MRAKITDGLNWAGKINARKVKNIVLLWGSYHLSRWRKKAIHRGLPMSISIEPTTACNLRCPECPSGLRKFSRPTGNLKKPLITRILDELSPVLTYVNFYFQGEPFINPGFLEMVKEASSRGIYTSTSTNAHFLTDEMAKKTVESGLDRLIISIDGTTQEVYEQYRKGGNLNKVLSGTKNLVRWKKNLKSSTPHIIFQFLVVKPNEHQIEDVKKLAKEIGVDEIKFKTAQVYDFVHGNPLIPENIKYSRYRKGRDGTWEIKNKLVNQCWRMWHSCVITWDGSVVPCCFDKDAHHKLGQVEISGFENVWKNQEYQKFRNALLKSRSEIDICKNCSEGTKVWA